MKKYMVLAGVMIAMVFGANATAKEKKKAEAPKEPAEVAAPAVSEPVDCDAFVITPPAGWIRIAGSLTEKELSRLPENIREYYTRPMSDVIFIDLASPDEEDSKNFKDSLNVVAIGEKIPLNEKLVTELTNVLKSQYDSMFENFKLDSSKLEKIGNTDVLVVRGSYGVLDYSVNMEQVLYPTSGDAYVLTCSYDSKGKNAEAAAKACREAIETFKMK